MFGNASLPSRIWSYGADAPHEESRERVEGQYRAAHRYRNKLCEIERARREASEKAIRRAAPDLEKLDAEVLRLQGELDAALAEGRGRNQSERKRVKDPELTRRIKELRGLLREARSRLNVRRREVYADPRTKAALGAVTEASFAAKKLARAETEAFWPTYLQVEQAAAKFGTGAPPRFLRWTGEGKIAVQIQGGLPVTSLFTGTDRRFRLVPIGGLDYTAYLRVGSEGREPVWARCDVRLHRLPPYDAKVQWVYLTRRREGTRYRWWLQLVLARAAGWDRPDAAKAGRVAVDLGWRLLPDGTGLRVAYWLGDDGAEGELVIPHDRLKAPEDEPEWRPHATWDKPDDLRSIRDKYFDGIRLNLAEWLRSRVVPDWLRERTVTLGQWRSTARLAALILHWRGERFAGDEEMFEALEAWRKRDKHLYNWEGSQRGKLVRWRDDLYAKFACGLMRRYREIVLEDVNWRELAKVPEPGQASLPGGVVPYRRVAAVGRLTELLKERMEVVWVDPAGKATDGEALAPTMRCAECGEMDAFDAARELVRTCRHCHFTEDQDRRACRVLLAAASGQVVELG